jgi:hypothetical protein
METISEHDKCVNIVIDYFKSQNIRCEDFEKIVGPTGPKRPDLLLPDFKTLIEIKTFLPTENQMKMEEYLVEQANLGISIASDLPIERDRFDDDLTDSRRKFREFPDYSTTVIFFDLHKWIHAQIPELLLGGETRIHYDTSKFPAEPIISEQRERPVRRDWNTEIGAIVFFEKSRNIYKVYYNVFAELSRRISSDIFKSGGNEHYDFVSDIIQPKFSKIEFSE